MKAQEECCKGSSLALLEEHRILKNNSQTKPMTMRQALSRGSSYTSSFTFVSTGAGKETGFPDQFSELVNAEPEVQSCSYLHVEPCSTRSLHVLLMTDTSLTSITFNHAFESERWSQKGRTGGLMLRIVFVKFHFHHCFLSIFLWF